MNNIIKKLPKGTKVYWMDPQRKFSDEYELTGYDEDRAVLENENSQCTTDPNEIVTEDFLDGWVSNFPKVKRNLNWNNLDLKSKGRKYERYLIWINDNERVED